MYREIDIILVWRLDRWGRSLSDVTATLEDPCTMGVDFVSVTDALDLTTPIGRALVGMLSAFAQFERDLLRERVKAGMAAARKKGKHCGRAATAKAKLDEIQELHKEGLSNSEIAKRLNVARPSVVRLLAKAA